jgi:hypothetical protein
VTERVRSDPAWDALQAGARETARNAVAAAVGKPLTRGSAKEAMADQAAASILAEAKAYFLARLRDMTVR